MDTRPRLPWWMHVGFFMTAAALVAVTLVICSESGPSWLHTWWRLGNGFYTYDGPGPPSRVARYCQGGVTFTMSCLAVMAIGGLVVVQRTTRVLRHPWVVVVIALWICCFAARNAVQNLIVAPSWGFPDDMLSLSFWSLDVSCNYRPENVRSNLTFATLMSVAMGLVGNSIVERRVSLSAVFVFMALIASLTYLCREHLRLIFEVGGI